MWSGGMPAKLAGCRRHRKGPNRGHSHRRRFAGRAVRSFEREFSKPVRNCADIGGVLTRRWDRATAAFGENNVHCWSPKTEWPAASEPIRQRAAGRGLGVY
jgi:hypothetical protein